MPHFKCKGQNTFIEEGRVFRGDINSYYIKNKIKYLLPRVRGLAYKMKMSFMEICETQDVLFLWLETWFWTILSCNAGPDSLYVHCTKLNDSEET